jgi:hypothetical protein
VRREADLDAADPFLPLVLGVASALRRFDAVVALAAEAPQGAPAIAAPEDRATLHLLLGLVSLRARCQAHLDAAAAAASAPRAAAASAEPAPRPSLLR